MSLASVTTRTGKRKPRRWHPHRLWTLCEGLENGLSDAQLARRLDTTRPAIQTARKRYRIAARTRQHHTARDVQRLMGIGCSKTVACWVQAGWLKARRLPRGQHDWYSIRHDDLLVFLESLEHWHRWEPERIADHGLRHWAIRLRAGVRFLTIGEVALRCCVGTNAVNAWIQQGRIQAYKNGNWYVRESDLDGFTPPGQVSKAGRVTRRWTAEEDGTILALRAEGAVYREIAAAVGRSQSGVHRRYRRLVGGTV